MFYDYPPAGCVLKNKFNLKNSIHSRNRIYIWASSVEDLIELVKPHMELSMLYKIDSTIKP